MKTKNLTPFPLGTKVTSRRPRRPEMTVVLRAAYVLAPGAPLALPGGGKFIEQGSLSGERFADDDEERAGECIYPGDFADWKPRAEVMLRGACHTPFGKPLRECPVRFEVGSLSKILRVVGRRAWSDGGSGAVMSEPLPFTTLPIGYANAFGGPGYARNPVGKGFSGAELPNVEHAGSLIRARRDDPGPAGFGPLSSSWLPRSEKVGKDYGSAWRKERAPFYALDFDFSYFNAAPADQQIEGFLRGDELVTFQNLHPQAALFSLHLPALRVRAFVNDVKGRFREVPMGLDTLFADLSEERLYLTWRGLDAVESDDLEDVVTMLVASEPLASAPLSESHYRGLLAAFEADPLGLAGVFSEDKQAEVDALKARLAEHTAAVGTAPPKVPEGPAPDPITALFRERLGSLPGSFAGANDTDAALAQTMAEVSGKAPPEVSQPLLAGLTVPVAPPKVAPPKAPAVSLRPGGPPPAEAASAVEAALKNLAELRRKVAERPQRDGEGADEVRALEEQLGAAVEKLEKEPFFQQMRSRPAPKEPAPHADLSGQDYHGRDLRGVDLRGANLRDADLSEANLSGAALQGACLDGAILVAACLDGADLTGADLTLCNATQIRAQKANFRDVTLDRAWLKEAVLTGAVLAGARGKFTFLPACDLTSVDATGLDLEDAFARKAILEGANLSKSTLRRCYFLDVSAKGLSLRDGRLDRSSFAGSDLGGASFEQTRGDRSIWLRAKLDGASFAECLLPRAMFLGATGQKVSFWRAYLREARFFRAAIAESDFSEANLVAVDFTRATLRKGRFRGANLYDAKLRQAAGEGCDFTDANLTRAQMEES